MKWKFVQLALKNVSRNTRRSAITAMIMIFGTAAIVIAGGFFKYSFWGLADYAIHKEHGHLQVVDPDSLARVEDVPLEYGIDNAREMRQQIDALEHVAFSMPRLEFMGLVSNGEKSVAYLGRAGIPACEKKLAGNYHVMDQGRYLGDDPGNPDGDGEVILTSGLARSLKVGTGDFVTLLATTTTGALNAVDVEVVGVFSTGIPEMDARFLSVNVATAQRLLRSDRVSKMVVVLDDRQNTETVAAVLGQRLPGYAIKTWEELALFYQAVVKLYTTIFTFLGIIIFVVVALASANTMMMSIFERTREVGTVMAIGSSRKLVLANFLLEGLVIGAGSAAAGLLVAAMLTAIINNLGVMMPPPPGSTTPYALQVQVVPAIYFGAFFFTLLTAVAATLLPAYRASRISIVEAMGHN